MMSQTVLRPGVLVHTLPLGADPVCDRALPEGDPPRLLRARRRAVQARERRLARWGEADHRGLVVRHVERRRD